MMCKRSSWCGVVLGDLSAVEGFSECDFNWRCVWANGILKSAFDAKFDFE